MNVYGHYCRPGLVRLLEAFSLDAVYERAEGNYLWQRRGERLIKVLDLVGGFGANLFGHYHPELLAEEQRLLAERVPIQAQGSCRLGAARLAKALCDRLGDYVVIFANSGAETVEAALKHAFLERRRPICWAVKSAFHGKTLGAIQLTDGYREPYTPWGPRVHFLDPDDPSTWEAAKTEVEEVAAAFVEPIKGEGGVKPLPQPFINWLMETCPAADIPIVIDEIQAGMGRTGAFLASEPMGLIPDYLCLSKALGGGLAKIGALLVKRERFVEEFSVKHTSTFAEDDRSCLIALKALEILDSDDLPGRCAARGEYLLTQLESLRARFPEQIKEVRGKGLMIGLELQDHSASASNGLRMLSQQNYLGHLTTAYLLHAHCIRVAPTLSEPFTIRVEPSAYITEAELDRFVEALGACCEALKAADMGHLTSFQIGLPPPPIADYTAPRPYKREPPRSARRVAFLGHLILPEHAILWDASLDRFRPAELGTYMAKPSRVLGPTIFDQINVRSCTGDEVHLSYLGLDITPPQAMAAMENWDTGWIMEKIEEAVVMAREAGCQVLGLGGYTSIISGNCCRVKGCGIALTSGNALTVGMGIAAMKKVANEVGINLSRSKLGIVGATGNIAATYALMMAGEVSELVLIVRDSASPRLKTLIDEIHQAAPHLPLRAVEHLDALRDCSLIVAASNAPEPLIYPESLPPGPVVICDISLPSDIAPAVGLERPEALVIHGGLVRLPCNDDFVIAGIPLGAGYVYACMAETLLMGLEGMQSHGSYGLITPSAVKKAMAMAERHGFTLGQLKTEWAY